MWQKSGNACGYSCCYGTYSNACARRGLSGLFKYSGVVFLLSDSWLLNVLESSTSQALLLLQYSPLRVQAPQPLGLRYPKDLLFAYLDPLGYPKSFEPVICPEG